MDIQALSDRAEIADLLARYCRGLDRMDEPLLRSIYHDDAVEDRGPGLYIGNAQDWISWSFTLLPVFRVTQHAIQNSLIELDGGVAYAETYFRAYHRFGAADQEAAGAVAGAVPPDGIAWPAGETEMIMGGRYLDRFSRRGGVWKIAYRKMINDWTRTQPVEDEWLRNNPTAYRGVRHPDDARLDTRLHPTGQER